MTTTRPRNAGIRTRRSDTSQVSHTKGEGITQGQVHEDEMVFNQGGVGMKSTEELVEGLVEQLTDEVWLRIMEEIEDTDLQTLTRVSHFFHRLATDLIFWRKHVFMSRNLSRIEDKLFHIPQRPDREWLVARNILRGVMVRQIREGLYVNGPGIWRYYDRQVRLRHELVRNQVHRRLRRRPPLKELSERNLLPSELTILDSTFPEKLESVSDAEPEYERIKPTTTANTGHGRTRTRSSSPPPPSCSPVLLPRLMKLRKAFCQDSLKRQLRGRLSQDDLRDSGVAKTHTVTKYCAQYPLLLATQLELSKRLIESQLVHKLERRPSVEKLEGAKVLMTGPDTAAMVCPGIKPKVRFYEELSGHGGNGGPKVTTVAA
ncbi:hypothetical protein HK102_005765 [Quaeritorhiza haematococci]|nr:hypothetical protein HK102_005765 [Quaeritorhiza haematococci]